MSQRNRTNLRRAVLSTLTLAAAGLSGCAVTSTATAPTAISTPGASFSGSVHGGQQPVSGATIQLYAATTGGYGAAATALLNPAATTNATGGFGITGQFTCPANSMVYITATGGNPGFAAGTSNPNLAMMAALGPCSSLSGSTFIQINELTTIGSVWPLARFMTGYASLGTSPTNNAGMVSAFNAVNKVVNVGSGNLPGAALPNGATLPTNEINTLADVLASCINSTGGVASNTNTACGALFDAATPAGGTAPTDTIAAAINIARNPGSNIATLYGMATPSSPYQPTLAAAPNNFLIGISYVGGGLSTPKSLAIDAAGNVWTANSGNASLTELSSTGTALSPSTGFTGGGLNGPASIAFDPAGSLWVANTTGSSVSKFNAAGTAVAGSPFTGGGLSTPTSLSVDGSGNIWVANAGNSSVTELNASGAALSPAAGYTGAGISNPVGIAVNPK